MMNVKKMFLAIAMISLFVACRKDKDPVFNISPSAGAEKVSFNGIAGNEPGNTAGNSVYLDLRGEKTTAILRAGWDLGFYNGNDFRVILNNTSIGGAKVLTKNDLALVNASDTMGLLLSVSQLDPQVADLAFFDDINGDLNKTVIPAVSENDALNRVIILNRGTGGSIAPRPWIKLRVLRRGTGYLVQYAGILETTFKTIEVQKNPDFNFQFLSIDKGIVNVEPEKNKWDIVWSYSVFEANFGWGIVPYSFSDLIAVNYLAGVQVKLKSYADAASATAAYAAFNKDSIATNPVVAGRWTIGNTWRSTQPATGARQDRFYLIKDTNGNYYKFKCLAMGVGADGGTRGKPDFAYALIAK